MRLAISARHLLESRSQSRFVGAFPSGSEASAERISSSGMPAAFPAWITATRRRVTLGYRRWFPSVRLEEISRLRS